MGGRRHRLDLLSCLARARRTQPEMMEKTTMDRSGFSTARLRPVVCRRLAMDRRRSASRHCRPRGRSRPIDCSLGCHRAVTVAEDDDRMLPLADRLATVYSMLPIRAGASRWHRICHSIGRRLPCLPWPEMMGFGGYGAPNLVLQRPTLIGAHAHVIFAI
ncbi:hypothetical protein ACLOJK_041197 [Asimina triloba]